MRAKKTKEEIAKGEFQHKMFKLLILIIAFTFICLIIGFIYITITSSNNKNLKILNNQYNSRESIVKSNYKYKHGISIIDTINYNSFKNNTELKFCSLNKFYKEQIYKHIPCINNINNIKINLFENIMKLISNKSYNKNNNNEGYFKIPRYDNYGKIIINNNEKNIKITMSPISQIKFFNDDNYFNIDEKSKFFYEFNLKKNDFLYVPSFYYLQIKENVDDIIVYEYQDNSNFNNMIFKILY